MTPFLSPDIPRIGLGCWAIGGPFFEGDTPLGYGAISQADARATIDAAYDAGIRIFDTAAIYGCGASEERLGAALKGRDDALIVTKLGFHFDAEAKQVLGVEASPDGLRRALEASLKRLQRDRVDMVLLHLNAMPVDEAAMVFDTFDALRDEGKLAAYGWSTDFPDSVSAMAPRDGFQAIQHAMNVFVDVPTITARGAEHGLAAFIRSPLAMGMLSGKYATGQALADDDIRANTFDWIAYFKDGKPLPEFVQAVDALRELLSTGGRSPAQGALCWLLAKAPHLIPIPGARNAEQALQNAAALQFGPLPADVMDEIETVFKRPPEGPARER
ncbi:aldo/keto reductase [Actibacterium mucosum KCTC 23349]|uniref:Aldo/keto reductase n=1 Tax=Actibacterium mucosum KCTC 23349 TaxID=1454373 RepID=A0A037ZHH0_9RHOB|nr:aldo/keto reductase [Actibacterium mucosum]KAJ54972.1 aldo/keto reductase [Actibacterium mucosum KCTC 23349]